MTKQVNPKICLNRDLTNRLSFFSLPHSVTQRIGECHQSFLSLGGYGVRVHGSGEARGEDDDRRVGLQVIAFGRREDNYLNGSSSTRVVGQIWKNQLFGGPVTRLGAAGESAGVRLAGGSELAGSARRLDDVGAVGDEKFAGNGG